MARKTRAYASFDVETDGNNPVQHSLRSIGIALFVAPNTLIDTFYFNVVPQIHRKPEKKCMQAFWMKHPEMWALVNRDAKPASFVMKKLSDWLYSHSKTHVITWVASPSNFDWMFLKCVYEEFGPKRKYELGFYCHDLTSLARAYRFMHNIYDKAKFLKQFERRGLRLHHALDDAIRQGYMYMQIRVMIKNHCIRAQRSKT